MGERKGTPRSHIPFHCYVCLEIAPATIGVVLEVVSCYRLHCRTLLKLLGRAGFSICSISCYWKISLCAVDTLHITLLVLPGIIVYNLWSLQFELFVPFLVSLLSRKHSGYIFPLTFVSTWETIAFHHLRPHSPWTKSTCRAFPNTSVFRITNIGRHTRKEEKGQNE